MIPPAVPAVLAAIIVAILIIPVIVPPMIVDTVGWLLRSRPDDYVGWCHYGRLLASRGRLLEAAEALHKAVALKPDYAEAWWKLGDILTTMQQTEAASEAYRNAALGDPTI